MNFAFLRNVVLATVVVFAVLQFVVIQTMNARMLHDASQLEELSKRVEAASEQATLVPRLAERIDNMSALLAVDLSAKLSSLQSAAVSAALERVERSEQALKSELFARAASLRDKLINETAEQSHKSVSDELAALKRLLEEERSVRAVTAADVAASPVVGEAKVGRQPPPPPPPPFPLLIDAAFADVLTFNVSGLSVTANAASRREFDVSFVVPLEASAATSQVQQTLLVLRDLIRACVAKLTQTYAMEVIFVHRRDPGETADRGSYQLAWRDKLVCSVRAIGNGTQASFVAASNVGALAAKGNVVVFWSPRVELTRHSGDFLVHVRNTFRRADDVALLGAVSVTRAGDERLRLIGGGAEAGALQRFAPRRFSSRVRCAGVDVMQTRTVNLNELQQVPYCLHAGFSFPLGAEWYAAAEPAGTFAALATGIVPLAVRRSLFVELRGFDAASPSPFFAGVDLALRARALDRQTRVSTAAFEVDDAGAEPLSQEMGVVPHRPWLRVGEWLEQRAAVRANVLFDVVPGCTTGNTAAASLLLALVPMVYAERSFQPPAGVHARGSVPTDQLWCKGWPQSAHDVLMRASAAQIGVVDVHVSTLPPPLWPQWKVRRGRPQRVIGVLTHETDELPADWLEYADRVDQIWVENAAHKQALVDDGGVRASDVVLIPPCVVNLDLFNRRAVLPVPQLFASELHAARTTRFLVVTKWRPSGGMHALLVAYFKAFAPTSDVSLVIHVNLHSSFRETARKAVLDAARELWPEFSPTGDILRMLPHVVLLIGELPESEMPALYQQATAFVSMARGSVGGATLCEAMAMGVPAIATATNAAAVIAGGDSEAQPETAVLLTCVPGAAGDGEFGALRGTWCESDEDELIDALRRVDANAAWAHELGEAGARRVEQHFGAQRVAARIAKQLATKRKDDDDDE
jgi:glycosyltransferase involved in cell wall biosynthesis